MRTLKLNGKDIIAQVIMELLRASAYCALIVFLLNTIFNIEMNEAIPFGPTGLLWFGGAAFLSSTVIKLYLLRDVKHNV